MEEKYKQIDFELKMLKRIQEKYKNKSDVELKEFLQIYNLELEKANQNNWIDTYKILSILVENIKIKYTLLQVKDEIFGNTMLSYVWLVLNDEGDIANDIHFRFELKKEYQTRISNGILRYDKAIIEVDKRYQKEVESILNSICHNWDDKINIRYIALKSDLGV